MKGSVEPLGLVRPGSSQHRPLSCPSFSFFLQMFLEPLLCAWRWRYTGVGEEPQPASL